MEEYERAVVLWQSRQVRSAADIGLRLDGQPQGAQAAVQPGRRTGGVSKPGGLAEGNTQGGTVAKQLP